MNTETKPWYTSKTIIGAIVTALSLLAGFFGLKIDAATQAYLVEQSQVLITAGGTFIGLALTIWGRITAKQPISG
jgi:protein-S-isoprenylcysteine O-methyltransferase Ste14